MPFKIYLRTKCLLVGKNYTFIDLEYNKICFPYEILFSALKELIKKHRNKIMDRTQFAVKDTKGSIFSVIFRISAHDHYVQNLFCEENQNGQSHQSLCWKNQFSPLHFSLFEYLFSTSSFSSDLSE